MYVQSVDPGKNLSGYALHYVAGRGRGELLVSCLVTTKEMTEWYKHFSQRWPVAGAVLAIEQPVIQMGDIKTKRASELLALAKDLASCDVVQGRWIQLAGTGPVVCYEPASWKGGVPKAIHNERVLSRLTPEERKLVPTGHLSHNAIDAIGIGQHHIRYM